jgi:hypothetical protein
MKQGTSASFLVGIGGAVISIQEVLDSSQLQLSFLNTFNDDNNLNYLFYLKYLFKYIEL